ncbi:MAG: rRNA maturation RNase YbeY [Patescibacteria group bacterium]
MKVRADVACVNLTRRRIPVALVQRVVARAVSLFERSGSVAVSVVFVGERRMRTINRTWRKRDCPTDVLSFGFLERTDMPFGAGLRDSKHLGEIVICPAYAAVHGLPGARGLATLAVHGVVHVYGIDHERSDAEHRKTIAIQKRILAKFFKDQ